MRVAIAGGNGFIGRSLTRLLIDARHEVTWLSHRAGHVAPPPGVIEVPFDPNAASGAEWRLVVGASEAIVNLSGHPLSARWNPRVKELLRTSRIDTTRALVDAIADARMQGVGGVGVVGPSAFIGACGVGIYGDRGDTPLTEVDSVGGDWLADLAVEWERQTMRAEDLGCRAVSVRNGLVLGDEGLIPRMLPPMQFFVGGPVGSGDQYVPWVHYSDIAAIYRFVIERDSLHGPVNACAPSPVPMREFSAAIGHVVHRPSWFRVPNFALRIVMGEAAPYLVMSQRALPAALLAAGYEFRFLDPEDALRDVIHV